jgi:hypothetical protein
MELNLDSNVDVDSQVSCASQQRQVGWMDGERFGRWVLHPCCAKNDLLLLLPLPPPPPIRLTLLIVHHPTTKALGMLCGTGGSTQWNTSNQLATPPETPTTTITTIAIQRPPCAHRAGIGAPRVPEFRRCQRRRKVPLHPQRLKKSHQWSALWTAFEKFVQSTLIPLAEAAVTHPDLRPGFNCTANLLYRQDENEIRMVDLDSLVDCALWGKSNPVGRRYISIARKPQQRKMKCALDFVFKQVVVIAEAWIQEVNDGDADVDVLFDANVAAQSWTQNLSQVCDNAFIIDAMTGYRSQFGV